MEPERNATWEDSVQSLARRFDYPATPEIVESVGRRLAAEGRRTTDHGRQLPVRRAAAWAALVIVLVGLGLAAVPQTRAALLRLVAQIGAIRVYVDETAPTPVAPAPAAAEEKPPIPPPAAFPPTETSPLLGTMATPAVPGTSVPATATISVPRHSLELQDLGKPSTLEAAQSVLDFPVLWPDSLGDPDALYLHDIYGSRAVTLVWEMEDGPLTLTEIGAPEFAFKLAMMEQVTETKVGGRQALWVEGPHALQLNGRGDGGRLQIDSNVLLWTDGAITYRLEGDLSLDDALSLAGSVTP